MGAFTFDPGYKYPLVLIGAAPGSHSCCVQMRFRGLKVYSQGTWELVDGYAAEGGFYDNFHLPPYGTVDPDGDPQAIELQRGRPPLEIWIDSQYLYDIYTDVLVPAHGPGFYALLGAYPTGIQIVHGRGQGLMTVASLSGNYREVVHRCERCWCDEDVRDIACLL